MTARVFISYRTSDGADKATALARDLDARFGNEQVFLDKDDLAAGSRWRDEIARALHGRPILLVLVTPQYLGAVDAQGRRRIDRPDDPARTELAAALAAGAHVVPLICDGVDAVPDASALPPPFDQLAERTWRRLRAYDWKDDMARLAADLGALGLVPRAGPAADSDAARPNAAAATRSSRRGLAITAGALALAAAGGAGWWLLQQRDRAGDLSGRWEARIGARGAAAASGATPVPFEMAQHGDSLRLTSSPVDVTHDADWTNYRDFWRQQTGRALRTVRYRGEGTLTADPDSPRRVSIALRIEVADGGEQIDGGNLSGSVGPAGRRIEARFWVNSEQAERAVVLRRVR